ncbi:MAG: PDZ domain-containing protein [Acidobacteria bacterium]|nr:PDZ domain-containing protein [Acidobacteriota bacterium]
MRSILADKMYLGVTLAPGRWGTVITDVDEESPAERAGLDAGDRIIGINGHDCRGKSPSQIKRYLNPRDNGRDLTIVVVRLGELLRLHARLAPLPPERIEQIVANHLAKQHDDSEGH